MTTDTMSRAYSERRATSIVTRRTVFLVATPGHSGRKTAARCVATNGGGRSNDSLPGSRTFDGSSCAMNDWPRTFLGCYTWPAASFCCGVMRWLLVERPPKICLVLVLNGPFNAPQFLEASHLHGDGFGAIDSESRIDNPSGGLV